MLSCITTALVTFTLFGGGQLTVRGDQIEAFEESECREYFDRGFFKGYEIKTHSCRLITLKSGKHAKITESTEEIKKILENKNGK